MKALVIIDMQVGVFFGTSPRFDMDGVISKINTLADHFRSRGDAVIFIRHDGTKENYLFPGTSDWQILPGLYQGEDDLFLEKTANDSFYRTQLEDTLKSLGIKELCIAGCATDFCVNATIHAALVKDFDITVAKDCHTTADRPNFKAQDLISFHNWLWANLTPTDGRISVKELSEILKER